MLQIDVKSFASDALEDAMRLAQTKAINSYSWSDCLNYLNYSWSDLYNRIAMIDDGYYSNTVRLTKKLTHLPPFVKNTIKIYAAQDPIGFNRDVFRSSGMSDMCSRSTYHLSGFDLYCPDAESRNVWLNYVPAAPMLFFTRNNRDPKLYEQDVEVIQNNDYNLYRLVRVPEELSELEPVYTSLELQHKNAALGETFNLLEVIDRSEDDWDITYISCDFPYIFVTYRHRYTEKYLSGFYSNVIDNAFFNEYNPFAFTGRDSNVEYLQCKWNDKTGLGVIIRDHNDYDNKENRFRVKELGWTPDTSLEYPCPEMFRYLVARLADKFAAFNESSVMAVSAELVEAKYAFEAFCKRDKSSWQRIDNVNGPGIGDFL